LRLPSHHNTFLPHTNTPRPRACAGDVPFSNGHISAWRGETDHQDFTKVRGTMMEGRIGVGQRNLRELSSGAVVGEYKANTKGAIFYADEGLATIFEYGAPEDMVSGNLFSWCKNMSDSHRITELLENPGSIENLEIESLTRGGNVKRLLLSASKEMGVVQGTIKDITQIQQWDKGLIQAQKLENLGTLAGGIAHDFNNILGIILGQASILERCDGDREMTTASIESITKAVQRGASLVRQILTFARKSEVVLAPVNVNAMIRELSTMLQETFPKTVELNLKLDPSIPVITMDQVQLHQALLNLCVNARDAINDLAPLTSSHGFLTIRTEDVPRSNLTKHADATASRYVCISVSDSGKGMDEATKERIFEPFFTTKGPGKGTGWGLAVVYGVMKAHRGFIDVESKINIGTTFRLYLPVPEESAREIDEAKTGNSSIRGGTETILVVEDEDSLRHLMKLVLEQRGYRALTAKDGIEAIQVYTQHMDEIALVFTDLGLPKMDGATAFLTLKEINPNVKAVFSSGFLDLKSKARLSDAQPKAFLEKPYNPNEALRMIREVLDRPA
jgi:two-component system, cell cycle sensor histidine kinase and response regulator CckA